MLLNAGTFNWVWPRSKSGPALHTASESGTAFAGPAGPSMPPMAWLFLLCFRYAVKGGIEGRAGPANMKVVPALCMLEATLSQPLHSRPHLFITMNIGKAEQRSTKIRYN